MIQDYLIRLRSSARFDSSGRFTVELAGVRSRFRALQIRPGAYLVRLMQAALGLGASRLDIHLGADAALLRFRDVHTDNLSSVRRHELFGGRAIEKGDDLRAGLLCSPSDRIGLYWSRCAGYLTLDGTQVECQEWPASSVQDLLVVLERSSSPAQRADEAELVTQGAWFSRFPVTLDGKRVEVAQTPLAEYCEDGPGANFSLPQRDTAVVLVGPSGFRTGKEEAPVKLRRLQLEPGKILDYPPILRRAVLLHAEGPSRTSWLSRGIVIESGLSPQAPAGTHLLLSALTGLTMVRNPAYHAELKEVQSQATRFVEEFRKARHY